MQIFSPVTRTDLKACAQSLRLWLMEIVAWMVEAIGFREGRIALNRHRVEARRAVRELIFLMMCAQLRFRIQDGRRRWMRPPSTPRGFRYAHRRIDMVRLYTRGIALKTFARMRGALDDLDRIVACAIARVPKSASTGRLLIKRRGHAIAVAQCRQPCGGANGTRAAAAPDTS